MEPVTLRVRANTLRTLQEIADERDASVSAIAREQVEKGLSYDNLATENERLLRRRPVEPLVCADAVQCHC